MAYTSIIKVGRLERSVAYVQDKSKTSCAGTLEDAVGYALNRDKTEQDVFESALNCTLDSAYEDMLDTKKRWRKTDGVPGYHLVQSFAAGEVTPELCHKIGVELAERVVGDAFEVVIATHLNTDCLHNHIVFNSVSFVDGRKYHSNAKSYYTEVRVASDALCQKYKLSVIVPEKDVNSKKAYAERKAEAEGKPTWRTVIRHDVDAAVEISLTWKQFVRALEKQGYTLRFDRKHSVLKPPVMQRFVRFHSLGARYLPDAIVQRILYPKQHQMKQQRGKQLAANVVKKLYPTRLRTHGKPIRKTTGLRALYFQYLYRMGAFKRKPKPQSVPYAIRQDVYRLDQRIKQMRFLTQYGIDTRQQLANTSRKPQRALLRYKRNDSSCIAAKPMRAK